MFKSAAGASIYGALDKLAKDVSVERDVVTDALGHALETAIVNKLSTPGRGKIRRSTVRTMGKKGRKGFRTSLARADRVSAPGDPPAPDNGELRQSIKYSKDAKPKRVGSDKVYAPPLEFGTKRAGRSRQTVILPRPFMRPAFEEVRAGGLTDKVVGTLRARRK